MRQTEQRVLVITHPDDKGAPTATSYALHEEDKRAWGQIRTWTDLVPKNSTWQVRIASLRNATTPPEAA